MIKACLGHNKKKRQRSSSQTRELVRYERGVLHERPSLARLAVVAPTPDTRRLWRAASRDASQRRNVPFSVVLFVVAT